MAQVLEFFSLPVLDTRLDAPRDLKQKQQVVSRASASKWNTLEFKFYKLAFLFVVPSLYYTAYTASNSANPGYAGYERWLSKGWIAGRKVDNTDAQYRFFRDNFFLLSVLIMCHVSIRKCVNYLWPQVSRLSFDGAFGMVFLFGVHGVNSFKILLHISIMYFGVRVLKNYRRCAVLWVWIFGVGTLFINNSYRNYKFANFTEYLGFIDTGFKGIVSRWDVFYNFTLLKMISFNLDYITRYSELRCKKHSKDEEESSSAAASPSSSSESVITKLLTEERSRIDAKLDIHYYSFWNYFAYITYAPLFIAGPILTFNDYICQTRNRLPSINLKRIFVYGLRFLFCVLVMELLLHFIYVVIVSKTRSFKNLTPFQISMIGLFNLNIIWLKLLIPWRLFRLWSLLDGIDPPENMIRCMDNNYSALMFWKGWHRSFNKFVVKYVYIPLGGGNNRILASLCVFTFVAIWHDIELKLLLWGWLIVLCLIPEIFARIYFKPYENETWFRYFSSIGAVLNIWLMMIANLYGFCLGHDGTINLLKEMFSTWNGLKFFIIADICLFIAVQVMFEIRESEKRKGIDVKC